LEQLGFDSIFLCDEMIPIRERHEIAIGLLRKLDLDNVVLEWRGGSYFWRAWTPPVPAHNGHHVVKRGRVRVPR
jgi:hypothetical protein